MNRRENGGSAGAAMAVAVVAVLGVVVVRASRGQSEECFIKQIRDFCIVIGRGLQENML